MEVQRLLTLRYAAGLALIATVMVAAYLVQVDRTEQQGDAAYLVNIAGMQRMLSQRIARSADQVVQQGEFQALTTLTESIAVMDQNHSELITHLHTGDVSLALDLLYTENDGVDHLTNVFLVAADELANAAAGGAAAEALAAQIPLPGIASDQLLMALDAAVVQLQEDYEARISGSLVVEKLLLAAGLSVLLLQALLIFRPTVKRIAQTHADLELANDELRQFSFQLSNDLRAPIASSRGLIKMADQALDAGEHAAAKQGIGRIRDSLIRLDSLIEDVVNVTRNRAHVADIEPVNLADLVEEAKTRMAELPGRDTVTIRTKLEKPLVIDTTKAYLQQIIESLISNAIKYQDPAKDTRFVEVSASETQQGIDIAVTDNGLGVPEKFRADLFKLFRRFHPKASFGSGLGLYLTSVNATALGGKIHYEPTEDGSRFCLRIANG